MPEKQGIFNFEKQEAGRDIYNVSVQHLATGKKANLLSIQYALRKGETTKGNFFKNEPEWVDFEQDYIVEREEVNEIIKNLEKDKVQLVLGKPASGKSIILKNVGFKLANQNKRVHIVELKKHQIEDVKLYFEAIPEINDENPIFIVDDAHLYHSECEKLIRDFKSGGKGKLIIGSRPTGNILPTHPKKTSEFQFLNKTEIHAEDVTDEMIRTFLKIKHDFNQNRIKTVSRNLEKYKNDLWQLSWALNSYKPEKDSVDDEEIYERIKSSITEIETKDKKTINAENVFLPLSIFSRFEIQVERKFFEKQMGIKKEIIDQLIGLCEMIEIEETGRNRKVSLHNSSIAELYFGAFLRYPSLGEEIKEKIINRKDENDLEFCSFYQYIITDPRNTIDVVINLRKEWSNENGGLTLLKKLVEEERIQKSIEKGIIKEEDILHLGECVSNIAEASEEMGLRLADIVSSKIKKEKNIVNIGLCMLLIAGASEEMGLRLVNSVSSKIKKEKNIHKIGICVGDYARACEEAGFRLAECVSKKIEETEDIIKIGACVSSITRGNEKVGFSLVGIISAKIEKEDDIAEIAICVYFITCASKEMGLRLVESVSKKIEKEKNIQKIVECIQIIALVGEEIAKDIINHLNPIVKKELENMIILR